MGLPDQVLGRQLKEGVAHVVDLGVGGHLRSRGKGPAGPTHTLEHHKVTTIKQLFYIECDRGAGDIEEDSAPIEHS